MRELSLHILDILQNSVEAGATRVELSISEDLAADRLTIEVCDNGRGIAADKLLHVFDPFHTSRKTRHVGLGLPLLKAAAERCDGDATITSEVGVGTTLIVTFRHSHLDRAPLGDMTGTLLSFVLGGACELKYVHRVTSRSEDGRLENWEDGAGDTEARQFDCDTAEIKAELGNIPLTHPEVREWLRQFITEGEAALTRPTG